MAGKKAQDSLSRYLSEMGKAKETDCYRVYEKHAKRLNGCNLNNPGDECYWKVFGEAVSYYGRAELFGSRETIRKGLGAPGSPAGLSSLLPGAFRKAVLAKFPKKCGKCGFHRFFGVRIEFFSAGDAVTLFCPNCKKEIRVSGGGDW